MKISTLIIEMAANVARLSQDMARARSTVDKAMGGITQAANAAKFALSGFVGAISVQQIVRSADAVTALQNRLKLATGSATAAKSAYEELFLVAQRSRVGFIELGSTYAVIARGTKEMGLSQSGLLKITEAVGNAMTISGGEVESMKAALIQFGQGLGSGILRGTELNSVMEQTNRLSQAIADGLGITQAELRDYAKEGKLTSEVVVAALQSQADVLKNEVAGANITVGQALTLVGNSLTYFTGTVDKATGASGLLANTIRALSQEMDATNKVMTRTANDGGGALLQVLNGLGQAIGRFSFALAGESVGQFNMAVNWLTGGIFDLNTQVDLMPDNLRPLDEQLSITTQKLADTQKQYDSISKSLATQPDSIWTQSQLAQLDVLMAKLRATQAEQRKLLGISDGPIGSVGSGDAALARAERAKWDAIQKEKAANAKAAKPIRSSSVAKEIKDVSEVGQLRNKLAQEAYDDTQKLIKAAKDAADAYLEAYTRSSEGAEKRLLDMQQEAEALLYASTNQVSLAQAIEYTTIARLEEQQVAAMGNEEIVLALQKEIEARKQIIGMTKASESLEETKKLAKENKEMWAEIDRTAESVFMDVALNGEDAFKRIGESIKREILEMLYRMTIKKWIFQISGQTSGSFGGGNGVTWSDLTSMYSAFTTGGASTGGSAAALGSWAGGSMSTANAVGSVYANTTGTGISGLLSTNSAYGTAGAAGGAGGAGAGAGTSAMGYMGYAALIVAAIMIAEKLYENGWNRKALGLGKDQVAFGQHTTYTADPRMQKSKIYESSPANASRQFLDALGFNEKWSDILSSTVGAAHLFGRKLNAYGYEAKIAGGDADVSGFARYKGGVFRSNKTVGIDIDPRDAALFDKQVEAVIEGSRSMARAMGLNEAAINGYTGTLRVNFKGAKTAEEQAKRLSDAFDQLQVDMLNAAGGTKYTTDQFREMKSKALEFAQAMGYSTESMAQLIRDGMLGRMSGAEVGAAVGDMMLDSIYNSLASGFSNQITALITDQIITPMIIAVTTGGQISAVVNSATIASVRNQAIATINVFRQIMADPELQKMFAELQTLGKDIGKIVSGSVKVQTSSMRSSYNAAADEAKRRAQEIKDAWKGIGDSIIDEIKRIRGEILGLTPEGQAALQTQFAITTARARAGDQEAAKSLPQLSQALIEMARETAGSLSDFRAVQGATMASLQATLAMLGQAYGFTVPQFAVGTNYVPSDMLAMVHQGEAIVPKAYNPAAGGGDEMVIELRALRVEVASLKAVNLAAASSAARMDRTLTQVTAGGSVMRTMEVSQ